MEEPEISPGRRDAEKRWGAAGQARAPLGYGGSWVQWQGVAWVLLVMSLAATALPLGALNDAAV